ncbi:MAG: NUDIX domain-containing protein [Schleiferiaceae bacterium]|jgi:8-oxo-dGTP diphosphatase|nr:NUDIX domain-containing protein [Schleiferiaceae bacterium]
MSAAQINPNVSVDCVVFGFDNEKLNVLLIEQKDLGQTTKQLALPGDLVLQEESLDEAASRVLSELTHLEGITLQQFQAFGDPNRVKNVKDIAWLQSYRENPQARVITVGYFALVRMDEFKPEASSFAERVFWCEMHEVPELAFDHNSIVTQGLERLRESFTNKQTGFELLPEKFTLNQLQLLHEIILDKPLDKRNFRKKVMKEKLVVGLDEKQKGVLHKPAQLFKLNTVED